MKKYERIEINPNIMFGKPVIKNTRITVEQILRKLAGGMTVEDILAAQEFAADYLADEEIAFA
jgi:uncharacterized protein (DUF433 family)